MPGTLEKDESRCRGDDAVVVATAMLFSSVDEFVKAPRRAVTVFGMAGVGKTRLSAMLRAHELVSLFGRLSHRHALHGRVHRRQFQARSHEGAVPAELLRSDSIYLSSNITFGNLDPLSTYLGTPGNPTRAACRWRNTSAARSSIAWPRSPRLQDVPHFIERAKALYGYDDFIADTGGSLIEVIDPADPHDPVVKTLAATTPLLYIRGTEKDATELVRRFKQSPKPMYYRPPFLVEKWAEYKAINGIAEDWRCRSGRLWRLGV